jgi:hypothetical protein
LPNPDRYPWVKAISIVEKVCANGAARGVFVTVEESCGFYEVNIKM